MTETKTQPSFLEFLPVSIFGQLSPGCLYDRLIPVFGEGAGETLSAGSASLLVLSSGVIVFLLVQSFYKLFTHQLFLSDPTAEKATRMLEPATKPLP